MYPYVVSLNLKMKLVSYYNKHYSNILNNVDPLFFNLSFLSYLGFYFRLLTILLY